jgi:hypothetical protein
LGLVACLRSELWVWSEGRTRFRTKFGVFFSATEVLGYFEDPIRYSFAAVIVVHWRRVLCLSGRTQNLNGLFFFCFRINFAASQKNLEEKGELGVNKWPPRPKEYHNCKKPKV